MWLKIETWRGKRIRMFYGIGVERIRTYSCISSESVYDSVAHNPVKSKFSVKVFSGSLRPRSSPISLYHSVYHSHCKGTPLRWPNSVFARASADAMHHAHKDFKKTNFLSVERSFYLPNTRTICVFFHYNWTQGIDGFSLFIFYKGMLEKVTMYYWKNRVKCNACAVARKIETAIDFAETFRLLTKHPFEFQDIWQKISSETTWMIYHEKSEFLHRDILMIQKRINGELRESPMSKFN